MMRRLRQAFVASCAVIAIAAVLVWLRNGLTSHLLECSWAEPFDAPGGSGYRQHCLQLIIGRRVTLAHSTDWCGAAQPVRFTGSADALVNPHLRQKFFFRSTHHPSGHDWDVTVPAWAFMLFSIVPLAAWCDGQRVRLIRRRLRAQGRCVICGYDLRASKDRCPECGRPISSA